MNVPLEITYRDVRKTDQIENEIRERSSKLEKLCPQLSSCRVALERPQQRLESGRNFQVRLDLTLPPGKEIVVKEKAGYGDIHDQLSVVVNKAFNVAEKRLKKMAEKMSGRVKRHPQQEVAATVARLFPDEAYGFIRTVDGQRDIYFHKNSVLHDEFDRLRPGIGVRFVEVMGEQGPQASTVEVVDIPKRT